jgi:hypothetical protein
MKNWGWAAALGAIALIIYWNRKGFMAANVPKELRQRQPFLSSVGSAPWTPNSPLGYKVAEPVVNCVGDIVPIGGGRGRVFREVVAHYNRGCPEQLSTYSASIGSGSSGVTVPNTGGWTTADQGLKEWDGEVLWKPAP